MTRTLSTTVAMLALVLIFALGVLAGCGSGDGNGGETQVSCDPNYSGACLDSNASDYDCAGGSGDGPDYTGAVQVVGTDDFGLDRDGDGYACE